MYFKYYSNFNFSYTGDTEYGEIIRRSNNIIGITNLKYTYDALLCMIIKVVTLNVIVIMSNVDVNVNNS